MLNLKHSLIIFSFFMSTTAFAQNHFSANIGASYGFGVFKNSVETFVSSKQEGNGYLLQNKKFSLGGGLGVSASFIFHLHKNFGLGLAIQNHFNTSVEFIEINEVSGIISENTRTLSAKRLAFTPFIHINTDFEKINTFIELGVSFNSTKQKLDESIVVSNRETKQFWEYTGKSGMGFIASWGVSYKLNDNIAIKLGISMEGYQFTPEHNYLKKKTIDGNGVNLSSISEIEKSVDFTDWVSDQYSQYPDPNSALQLPKQTFAYHNLSAFLNVSYGF